MKKIALITGATAGIGEATAHTLAEAGYNLLLNGRRNDRLKNLSEKLMRDYDCESLPMVFDVRDEEAVKTAFNDLPAKWNIISVLINNAGLASGKDPIDEGNPDDWNRMLDTNVKGLLTVTRYTLPYLKRAEDPYIVNIGSTAGKEVYPTGNVYAASKHAVDALSRSMRLDFMTKGIRISQIRPGLVETEFSLVRFKGDTERANKVYQGYTPLKPRDVAEAILYCLSTPRHVCVNDLEITPMDQPSSHYINKKQ